MATRHLPASNYSKWENYKLWMKCVLDIMHSENILYYSNEPNNALPREIRTSFLQRKSEVRHFIPRDQKIQQRNQWEWNNCTLNSHRCLAFIIFKIILLIWITCWHICDECLVPLLEMGSLCFIGSWTRYSWMNHRTNFAKRRCEWVWKAHTILLSICHTLLAL